MVRWYFWLMPTATTLFLDRDGVLNERIMGGYVTQWSQFNFLPGVLDALAMANNLFTHIIVVSNQQGVGKGLMTTAALNHIHEQMLAEVNAAGGRIDRIYTCTSLAEAHDPNRKPGIGMALQARADFPAIDFDRAIMVGDTKSDLLFAHKAGMAAIWIDHHTAEENAMPPFNYRCGSLLDAVRWLTNNGLADHEKG